MEPITFKCPMCKNEGAFSQLQMAEASVPITGLDEYGSFATAGDWNFGDMYEYEQGEMCCDECGLTGDTDLFSGAFVDNVNEYAMLMTGDRTDETITREHDLRRELGNEVCIAIAQMHTKIVVHVEDGFVDRVECPEHVQFEIRYQNGITFSRSGRMKGKS